jgi:hypothetical protein
VYLTFGSLWQIVTIVCTGSYSKGVNGVTSSTTAQMLPYFVCSAYMVITPVILISYVLGHRMPEILVSMQPCVQMFLPGTWVLEPSAGTLTTSRYVPFCRLFNDTPNSSEPDSSVGIATGYGLDDQGVGGRLPVGARIFISPCRPDRLLGSPNGYRGSFPGGKVAGEWSWPLTTN